MYKKGVFKGLQMQTQPAVENNIWDPRCGRWPKDVAEATVIVRIPLVQFILSSQHESTKLKIFV